MPETPERPSLFMLHVTSEPLPMHPRMFEMIGEIVVHWSRIESAIDQDIHTLRRFAIVRNLTEVIPHTFSKKLELWRRSVRTLYPKIAEYQHVANEIDRVSKIIAKVRNHVIHGSWSIEQNDKGEFHVGNYRSVRGEWRYDQLWIGEKFLEALLTDVRSLSNHVMSFVTTRMVHGGTGMLQADVSPSPDHQAHSSPATHETPPDQPPPSEA